MVNGLPLKFLEKLVCALTYPGENHTLQLNKERRRKKKSLQKPSVLVTARSATSKKLRQSSRRFWLVVRKGFSEKEYFNIPLVKHRKQSGCLLGQLGE